MPLDPFFAERLRVHRRYLIAQATKGARERAGSWWATVRRAGGGAAAPAASTTKPSAPAKSLSATASASAPSPGSTAKSPSATARAKHRRAALAWDRTELKTVGTPGPDVETREFEVPVAGYPAVRVRVYRPFDLTTPAPAVLTFFGGAFRIGGIDYPTTDAANRRRAVAAGVVVVAVDYALAPEHTYPTQVEQGHAVLEWLFAESDELGIDRERVGISGTSAGGTIAAAVTLLNRDRGGRMLRLQVLEVPVVDLTARHIDLRATWALGIPSVIALRELRSVSRTYLRTPADARSPLASPLRAASHAGLPPALILTAQYDPLRANGAAYGAALRAAGVDVTVVQYLGVTHDIPIFTGALPAARAWEAQVVAALRSLHD